MKSFNKITNPEKFKIFISLFIIFSFINNSKAFGSEKKSTLYVSSDNQFEESYFKNSISYSEYFLEDGDILINQKISFIQIYL